MPLSFRLEFIEQLSEIQETFQQLKKSCAEITACLKEEYIGMKGIEEVEIVQNQNDEVDQEYAKIHNKGDDNDGEETKQGEAREEHFDQNDDNENEDVIDNDEYENDINQDGEEDEAVDDYNVEDEYVAKKW